MLFLFMFWQLKDMAEMVPSGSPSSSTSSSITAEKFSNVSAVSTLSQLSSPTAADNEANGHPANPLSSSGTKLHNEHAEWVVQDEPGVFITLSNLPGGGKNLKRIRFRYCIANLTEQFLEV